MKLDVEENKVLSRDGKHVGVIENDDAGSCDMEGCRGSLIEVKWSDGSVTQLCSRGLELTKEGMWAIV